MGDKSVSHKVSLGNLYTKKVVLDYILNLLSLLWNVPNFVMQHTLNKNVLVCKRYNNKLRKFLFRALEMTLWILSVSLLWNVCWNGTAQQGTSWDSQNKRFLCEKMFQTCCNFTHLISFPQYRLHLQPMDISLQIPCNQDNQLEKTHQPLAWCAKRLKGDLALAIEFPLVPVGHLGCQLYKTHLIASWSPRVYRDICAQWLNTITYNPISTWP